MAFTRLYEQPNPAQLNPAGGGQTTYSGGMQTAYAAPFQIPQPPQPPQPPKPPKVLSVPMPPRGLRQGGYQAPKVSPFLWNMLGNIKNMDVEERAGYLENLSAGIKDKLDQFGLRLARGRTLTPEQQARYNSLQAAFNDIQGYTTNQDAYDDYLTRLGGMTPEQYAEKMRRSAELAAWGGKSASSNNLPGPAGRF